MHMFKGFAAFDVEEMEHMTQVYRKSDLALFYNCADSKNIIFIK